MKHSLIQFATVAALAAGMAFAQSPAPAPQPGQGHAAVNRRALIRRRLMTALNLTPDQKAQAKTIFQQARQTAAPIREQLKANRQSMAAAVKANDTAQIQALASQQGNLAGQVAAIRAGAMARFYAGLTPAQRTQADQMQQAIHQRIQQRIEQRKNANNG